MNVPFIHRNNLHDVHDDAAHAPTIQHPTLFINSSKPSKPSTVSLKSVIPHVAKGLLLANEEAVAVGVGVVGVNKKLRRGR